MTDQPSTHPERPGMTSTEKWLIVVLGILFLSPVVAVMIYTEESAGGRTVLERSNLASDPTKLLRQAEAAAEKKDFGEARRLLAEARRLSPNDRMVEASVETIEREFALLQQMELVDVLLESGDRERAMQTLRDLVEKNPTFKPAAEKLRELELQPAE